MLQTAIGQAPAPNIKILTEQQSVSILESQVPASRYLEGPAWVCEFWCPTWSCQRRHFVLASSERRLDKTGVSSEDGGGVQQPNFTAKLCTWGSVKAPFRQENPFDVSLSREKKIETTRNAFFDMEVYLATPVGSAQKPQEKAAMGGGSLAQGGGPSASTNAAPKKIKQCFVSHRHQQTGFVSFLDFLGGQRR